MAIFPNGTVESEIERKYMPTLLGMGLTRAQANDSFMNFVRQTEGDNMLPRAGDILLELANTDGRARSAIESLKQHGVRDSDIRSWHNMHPLERNCLIGLLELARGAAFIEGLKRGGTSDDVTVAVFKSTPRFGNPDNADWGGEARSRLTDEDRPLPIELYNVVSDFVAVRAQDPTFEESRLKASSLNALVRAAIRSGQLHEIASEAPRLAASQVRSQAGCLGIAMTIAAIGFAIVCLFHWPVAHS